jgi:hypothetical protein
VNFASWLAFDRRMTRLGLGCVRHHRADGWTTYRVYSCIGRARVLIDETTCEGDDELDRLLTHLDDVLRTIN